MAKHYKTGDGSRIAPLGEVDDFEVAEGYPDVRGWRVDAADGTQIGKVHELLVDLDELRTRYLDVRLTSEVAAAPEDRDVLVPIGAARIDDDKDLITVPLTTDRVGLLPPYTHAPVTREQEYEVRRHFTFGRAAGAAPAGSTDVVAATDESRSFYDDEAYDDRRFFSARRAGKTAAADRTPQDELAAGARNDSEVRVPLQADDSVVMKRGDDGRDEIIIRRPRTDEQSAS